MSNDIDTFLATGNVSLLMARIHQQKQSQYKMVVDFIEKIEGGTKKV
jgi:hypothetical protein